MKRLQDILDQENYRRLINECGGKRIWIPKIGNLGYRDKSFIVSRNNEIVSLFNSGKSIRELAQTYRISIKRVYGIIEEEHKGLHKKSMGRRNGSYRLAM